MCNWGKSTRRGRWTPNAAAARRKSAERETLLIGHRRRARYYGERRILLKNLRGVALAQAERSARRRGRKYVCIQCALARRSRS
jgi:hypothetical protein